MHTFLYYCRVATWVAALIVVMLVVYGCGPIADYPEVAYQKCVMKSGSYVECKGLEVVK